jgi:type II restriction enzyme
LNILIDQNSKLPDVIIYDETKNWLFLIDTAPSHGPITQKRIIELEDLLKNSKAGKIYVTAFPDFEEYNKHCDDIAWDTHVWIADAPEHMIHHDGSRFLGPR